MTTRPRRATEPVVMGEVGDEPPVESAPAAAEGPPPEAGGGRRRSLQSWVLTIAVALIALMFLVPFYWLIISALRPANRIFADAGQFLPTSITLDNFRALFADTSIVSWFINSLILAGGATIGSLLVVTMAAYPLARIRFRGRTAIFITILVSQMLPFHLLLIPLFLMMINFGLIDTHLGVIVPLLAHPFGLFYMRQYMLGLPQEVLDAARVDGASEYAVFWRVVLPLVKPALATLAILFSLEQWNDLIWPLIVMRSEGNYPLSVGITSLIGLYRPRWDLVMTASVIAVLPVVLLFLKMRNTFISGLGSVGTGNK